MPGYLACPVYLTKGQGMRLGSVVSMGHAGCDRNGIQEDVCPT